MYTLHEKYGVTQVPDYMPLVPAFEWPCKKCGAKGPTVKGHDPCIANLPGVEHACCGHGVPGFAYVMFSNRQVIRGEFDEYFGMQS